jgi:hypothetical protein
MKKTTRKQTKKSKNHTIIDRVFPGRIKRNEKTTRKQKKKSYYN